MNVEQMEAEGVTHTCWSLAQWKKDADAPVHIMASDTHTLCGIRLTHVWNEDVRDRPPSEFHDCKRCEWIARAALVALREGEGE